jgi:hypothetical protein
MTRKPQIAELKLRVPVELHRALKRAARKDHWSVNQEVIQRLRRSFGIAANDEQKAGQIEEWIKAVAEHVGMSDLVERIETEQQKEKGNG